MAEIIDYGQFARRLQDQQGRSRWELLDAVQREWGYEDPGGEPVASRWGGENSAYGIDESLPVPEALAEWWDTPVNSFSFRPRLYWTHTQWPPSIWVDEYGEREADDDDNDAEGAASSDPARADGLPRDNPFLPPDAPDRRICVFMSEYQYCNQWGYLAAEAAHSDPRVLVSTGSGWQLQSRSLSEFFLQLALERLPGHYGWTLKVRRADLKDAPEVLERLTASYGELGLLPWQELGCDALMYGGPDALITHGRGPGADFALVIHGRTREALLHVVETLGIVCADKDIVPPGEVPEPLEELGPFALTDGDTDDRGRWRVSSTSDFPGSPPGGLPGSLAGGVPGGAPAVTVPAVLRALVPDRTAIALDEEAALAVAGDTEGRVHLWESTAEATADGPSAAASKPLHRAPVTALACVRLDAARRAVVSGDAHGVLRYWQTDRVPRPLPFERRRTAVTALTAAGLATGPALACAWADGLVRVWDLDSGAVARLRLGTGITDLALASDGTLCVTGASGPVALRLAADRLWPHRELQQRLHDVDWGSYWSARGPAHAVPGLIGKVASDDKKTAMDAVHDLYRLLVSKDSSLTAAAPAVPFLAELMSDPDNRARPTLLLLIADIADGDNTENRAAVRAVLPALRHLHDDPLSSIRWAAAELEKHCAPRPEEE
ncbi:WD40 repeat domain-containing protein [Streptomyces sp. NPDC059786]|uniref:WD40 repeat domain-containing protein n=1 Tax=Streptomyces sp. NPDC059786 TaxID=3346946 RepID=UPI00365B8004